MKRSSKALLFGGILLIAIAGSITLYYNSKGFLFSADETATTSDDESSELVTTASGLGGIVGQAYIEGTSVGIPDMPLQIYDKDGKVVKSIVADGTGYTCGGTRKSCSGYSNGSYFDFTSQLPVGDYVLHPLQCYTYQSQNYCADDLAFSNNGSGYYYKDLVFKKSALLQAE